VNAFFEQRPCPAPGYDRDVSSAAADRLRVAFELHDFGVRMYRQRLVRERPDASAEEIDNLVRAWLGTRPGAEHGDSSGSLSARFG